MNKVKQAQQFFEGVTELETVENTYRPILNGTVRTVEGVGKSYFLGTLDGKPFRGIIPTKAADVISVTDTEATFRLGPPASSKGEFYVTYRKRGTGMTDLKALSTEELDLEHAIRRETHAEHFANVECGIGDADAEARKRDAAFEKCGETAAELRTRGFVLRHDDSVPVYHPTSDR